MKGKSTNYIKKCEKKGKNIGGWFILRSVGNKAVDILFVMGNDRKSLPDELVGYSDHGLSMEVSI